MPEHLAKTPQCFHLRLSLFIGVGSSVWDFSALFLSFNFNHRIYQSKIKRRDELRESKGIHHPILIVILQASTVLSIMPTTSISTLSKDYFEANPGHDFLYLHIFPLECLKTYGFKTKTNDHNNFGTVVTVQD